MKWRKNGVNGSLEWLEALKIKGFKGLHLKFYIFQVCEEK